MEVSNQYVASAAWWVWVVFWQKIGFLFYVKEIHKTVVDTVCSYLQGRWIWENTINLRDKTRGENKHILPNITWYSFLYGLYIMSASTCQPYYSNVTNKHTTGRCRFERNSTIRAHLTPKGLVIRPSFVWATQLQPLSVCCQWRVKIRWGTFEKLPDAISRVCDQWCSHLQWVAENHWEMSRTTH